QAGGRAGEPGVEGRARRGGVRGCGIVLLGPPCLPHPRVEWIPAGAWGQKMSLHARTLARTRRAQARHVLDRDGTQVLMRTPDAEHVGIVRNLSTHGIGLVLDTWVYPGTEIVAQLTNSCRLFCCDLEMRVVHCTPQPSGSYLVGCEFNAPLPHETVRALVR